MTSEKTGVLLMAYGGPSNLEEVPGFLEAIIGKGRLTKAQVDEIVDRYRAIGGGSPIAGVTLRQARALKERLSLAGRHWPVVVGMRYSRPSVAEAMAELVEEGCSTIIGCPMAPHASPASTVAYRKALERAAEILDVEPAMPFVEGWHSSPRFLEAWEESFGEAWETIPEGARSKAVLIFTVHSLPVEVVKGSPYEAQVRETIAGIMERLGPLPWKLAWQSQGIRGGDWLTPDIPETLKAVAAEGFRSVMFLPIGFVADHVEVLYDLDIDARRMAEEMGLAFWRAPSLNDRPAFIEAVAEAVLSAEGSMT